MRTIKWVLSVNIVRSQARIQKGGFLSNTGPDQNYQASIQRWAIIGTPAKRHLKAFRWRPDDDPLLVIFGSSPP